MPAFKHSEYFDLDFFHPKMRPCQICAFVSTSPLLMANHLRTHRTPLPPFNCEAEDIESLHCKHCDFQSDLTITMRQHIEEIHSRQSTTKQNAIQIYTCTKCDFETYFCMTWLQHVNECRIKSKSTTDFAANNNLVSKAVSATGKEHPMKKRGRSKRQINWLRCDKCSFKSKSERRLFLHVSKAQHEKSPPEFLFIKTKLKSNGYYKCEKCSYRTKMAIMLTRHTTRYHQFDNKMYKCEHCSYTYSQMEYLEQHMRRTHENPTAHAFKVRPHLTNKSRSSTTRVDVRGHPKDLYRCDRCLYVYTKNEYLQKHISMAHHEEIETERVRRQMLQFHTYHKTSRQKMDKVRFKCGLCEFKANTVQILNLHKISEHQPENKYYQCQQCSFKTTIRKSFQTHFHLWDRDRKTK